MYILTECETRESVGLFESLVPLKNITICLWIIVASMRYSGDCKKVITTIQW